MGEERDRILYRFDAVGKDGSTMGGVVEGLKTVDGALEHAFRHLDEGHKPVVIRRNGDVVYDADSIYLEWEALKARKDATDDTSKINAFRLKLAAVQARQRCTLDQETLQTLHRYACELQDAIAGMEYA